MDDPVVQKCPKPVDAVKQRPLKIRACLFFDGTLNNRTNADIGAARRMLSSDEGENTEGSYGNDHTNIDKLQKLHMSDSEADFSFSIYVEGIGTIDKKSDSTEGAVLGTGDTGIFAKVEWGIDAIVGKIDTNIKKVRNHQIEYIYLDAFGFSRGAAAARNFVYAVLESEGGTLKDKLMGKGYSVDLIKIKFIGLFDTVASYLLLYGNDTNQLHLDSIRSAEYVVQIAAADEFRQNFRLTNIDSALNGMQVFLPGAHSDIGGGYRDEVEENCTVFYYKLPDKYTNKNCLNIEDACALNREVNWLVSSGWYLEEEINNGYIPFMTECSLNVNRKGVKNSYSSIPLQLMAHYAYKGGVNFAPPSEEDAVPMALKNMEKIINDYVFSLKRDQSRPEDWLENNSCEIMDLRHNYLHFSSQYFSTLGANDPNYTNGDPKTGRRRRIIQNG